MYVEDGRRGFLVVEGERQTVLRPLSRFDTHPPTRNQDGSCKLHLDDLTEILGTLNSVETVGHTNVSLVVNRHMCRSLRFPV